MFLLKTKQSWFIASMFGKLCITSIIIIPPCYISGLLFPIAIRLFNNDVLKIGSTTSRIYFINTLGSVIGPLSGIVLIPLIGIKLSMMFIATLFIIIGSLFFIIFTEKYFSKVIIYISINVVLIIICILQPIKPIINFSSISPLTTVVFYKEGFYQTIMLLKNKLGQTIFSIDGNIEADNHPVQLKHFILKGHLPQLLYPEQADVLVIGLGMGITLHALENNPYVNSVDVVELSPDVIKAQKYLKEINGDVLNCRKLTLINDDGRNYLSATKKKYSVINIDPIHPRISGVGILYTREFYKLVKNHLLKNGVFIQWMPSYQMSSDLFKIAVNSFYQTFNNSVMWYVRGHLLMIGFNGDVVLDYKLMKEKFEANRKDFESIKINSVNELLSFTAMYPEGIKSLVNDVTEINSDDNLYLEYHTPGEYLFQVSDIIQNIQPYWNFSEKYFKNIDPQNLYVIKKLWDAREKYVVEESLKPF